MNDKLGPGYIQLCDDNPITFISAYQYMLDALKAYDPIPESDKALDIPEFTDEEIASYYE